MSSWQWSCTLSVLSFYNVAYSKQTASLTWLLYEYISIILDTNYLRDIINSVPVSNSKSFYIDRRLNKMRSCVYYRTRQQVKEALNARKSQREISQGGCCYYGNNLPVINDSQRAARTTSVHRVPWASSQAHGRL